MDDVTLPRAGGEPPPKKTVVIEDGAYRPQTVRIRAGERVTWVLRDRTLATVQTEGRGLVEADRARLLARGRFDLHMFQTGEAKSIRFDRPGRFDYSSSFDPDMRGSVVVTAGEP